MPNPITQYYVLDLGTGLVKLYGDPTIVGPVTELLIGGSSDKDPMDMTEAELKMGAKVARIAGVYSQCRTYVDSKISPTFQTLLLSMLDSLRAQLASGLLSAPKEAACLSLISDIEAHRNWCFSVLDAGVNLEDQIVVKPTLAQCYEPANLDTAALDAALPAKPVQQIYREYKAFLVS